MKINKLLAMLLALAAVLSLTFAFSSCKKKDDEQSEEQETPEIKQYTVTFDADGGEFTSGESSYKADENSVYGSFITALPEVTKEGAKFAGWFNGDTEYNAGNKLTSDITYTAKWYSAYTVLFDVNGGELNGEYATEYFVYEDQILGDAIEAEPMVKRNGYIFDGWYCDETPYDANAYITEDTVYVAQWSVMDGVMTTDLLQGKWYSEVDMMTTLEASEIAGLPTGFDSNATLAGYFEFDGDKVSVYALEEDLLIAAEPYLEDLIEAMEDDVDFTYDALMMLYGVDTKSEVEERVKEDAGLPIKISGKALQIAVVEYIKSVDPADLIGDIVDSDGRYVLLDSVSYTVDPEAYTIEIDGDTMSLGAISEDSFKITSAEGKCAGYKGATLERQ